MFPSVRLKAAGWNAVSMRALGVALRLPVGPASAAPPKCLLVPEQSWPRKPRGSSQQVRAKKLRWQPREPQNQPEPATGGPVGSCTVAVIGPSGRRLQSQLLETNARALIRFLKVIPKPRHLCLEEKTHAGWLHEVLGLHVQEINIRRSLLPVSGEAAVRRTTREMRSGWPRSCGLERSRHGCTKETGSSDNSAS